MADKKIVEQTAYEVKTHKEVRLRMSGLHLFGFGVFSNVYKGTLLRKEGNKEIAIKKTWPEVRREKNFEVTFLSCENRRCHKNVIQMNYFFTNKRDDKVCESFVFDFMPETLHAVIRSTEMSMMDVKIYTWQMFSGLHYLSCMDIVHRDLKPVNMLVDPAVGLLKLSDFGSAKIITEGMTSTPYQVTRYYRPPELLLGAKHYDWHVDAWSAGCCFGEMLRKKTLFAGRDSKHQLRLIVQVIGLPSEAEMRAMRVVAKFEGQKTIGSGFAKVVPEAPTDALQMLAKILVFKPKERFCGVDFLKSPYFDELFAPGATRSNGQAVSGILDKGDITHAEMDEMNRREKKMEKSGEFIKGSNTTGANVIKIQSGSVSDEPERLLKMRHQGTVINAGHRSLDNGPSKMQQLRQRQQTTPEKNASVMVRSRMSKKA